MTIRYALMGLLLAAVMLASIRPLCAWMVWGGQYLETMN